MNTTKLNTALDRMESAQASLLEHAEFYTATVEPLWVRRNYRINLLKAAREYAHAVTAVTRIRN
jgi:hypothetical protein